MITNIASKTGLMFMRPEVEFLCELGKKLYEQGLYIAGGCIICALKGYPINDIDVISMHPETDMPEAFRKAIPETWEFTWTPKATAKFADDFALRTLEGKEYTVQLIRPKGKSVGEPNVVLSNFDIKNCMVYINEDGQVKSPIGLYRSVFSPRVSLNKVSSPEYTYNRVVKYALRGYVVDLDAVLRELMNIKVAQAMVSTLGNKKEAKEEKVISFFGTPHKVKEYEVSYIEPSKVSLSYAESIKIIEDFTKSVMVSNLKDRVPPSLTELVANNTSKVQIEETSNDKWDF